MPQHQSDDARDSSLSVMTFNIRADSAASRVLDGPNIWPLRKRRVLNLLREQDCDVIGLQECVDRQWLYLQPCLAAEYDSYAVGSDGRRKGELCALLWKHARFDLLARDTFWLNAELRPYRKMPHAMRRRICSWVRLLDRFSGAIVTLYNTHFDQRPGAAGDQLREHSAEIVLRQMEDSGLEHSILLGDLNCRPDSAACRLLRHELIDAHEVACGRDAQRTGSYHLWSDQALATMDYVFCTPDLRVEQCAIVRSHGGPGHHWPSDHFPVKAVVGI